MRRYLVVANQTLAGEPLVSRIRELARAGPCAFFLVVPATPPRDHLWTEGEARATARARLDEALMHLSGLEVKVEGEVGDGNPMLAIEDAIRDHGPFDEIILSTLPPGAVEVVEAGPAPPRGRELRAPDDARRGRART